MRHIGSYNGFECYEVSRLRDILTDEECVYILGTNGAMYFGGTEVGKVRLSDYRVLEFDLERYREKKRKARERTEYKVEVPACVAESTATGTEVAEGMDLCGTDEFFARVALDIDEMLKGVKEFSGE